IRRAARHGKELGYPSGFFADLVDDFVPMMEDSYSEIAEVQDYVKILLEQEERRFSATLNQGMKILDDLLDRLKESGQQEVDGEEIFKLYDTYGFPSDLAGDILQDHGFSYNREAFDRAMEEQRQRAKAAQDGKKIDLKVNEVYLELLNDGLENTFVGYRDLEIKTRVLAVLKDGKRVREIQTGDPVEILLAETPFYAESGGQVGDEGEIEHDEFRVVVHDAQSPAAGLNIARGEVTNTAGEKIELDDSCSVWARVSPLKRLSTQRNHTATHLLQAALRTVLGDHVKQAGSLVNTEKLRFDFSHYAPVTQEQLRDIETLVNRSIRANADVVAEEMSFDDAVKTGAMAIFGEKYGDHVRVVTAGLTSKELCGGCHTSKSGNIGFLKIVSEESIAAGIRRIEAMTGRSALIFIQKNLQTLENVAQRLKVPLSDVGERIEQMEALAKARDKQIEQLQKEIQKVAADKAMSAVKTVGDFKTLSLKVEQNVDLKSQAIMLQKNIGSGVILLGKVAGKDKISVLLCITQDLTKQLRAGDLIKELAPIIAGRGGGSTNMAQCGGTNPSAWEEMVRELEKRLEKASSI
ncbi:MAG: alanine--tRNA ligase, partial [Proteobacteria bacterium]|nr:alanine--tRNA ligase [Pseudomonadota bacterium]